MTNTSASGGYLAPSTTSAAQGVSLEDFLQAVFVGLSGLPGGLVRPRWQPKPPPQPSRDTTWISLGITRRRSLGYVDEAHDSSGDGQQTAEHHQQLEILVSAYGPDGAAVSDMIETSIQIRQNRDALYSAQVGFVEATDLLTTSDLLNQEWVPRHDRTFILSRAVRRTYPILNILSAQGQFVSDRAGAAPQNFIVEQT